ncbi:MAG: hypothetical protein RLY57_444 [Candidatus Parcubacteria bacterium]
MNPKEYYLALLERNNIPKELKRGFNGSAGSLLTRLMFQLQRNGYESFNQCEGHPGILLQLLFACPPQGDLVMVSPEELGIACDMHTILLAVQDKAAKCGLRPCTYGTLPMLLLLNSNFALSNITREAALRRLVLYTEPIDAPNERLFTFRPGIISDGVMVTTATSGDHTRLCELFADEGLAFGQRGAGMNLPSDREVRFIFRRPPGSSSVPVGTHIPLADTERVINQAILDGLGMFLPQSRDQDTIFVSRQPDWVEAVAA